MTRPFNGPDKDTLLCCRETRDAAGNHLSFFSQKTGQSFRILIINLGLTRCKNHIEAILLLAAGETSASSPGPSSRAGSSSGAGPAAASTGPSGRPSTF